MGCGGDIIDVYGSAGVLIGSECMNVPDKGNGNTASRQAVTLVNPFA